MEIQDRIADYYGEIDLTKSETGNFYIEYKRQEKEVIDEFSKKTGLNLLDQKILFVATSLQVLRWVIINKIWGNLGEKIDTNSRKNHNDMSIKKEIKERQYSAKSKYFNNTDDLKQSKKYRNAMEILMTTKVPYDAIEGSRFHNLGLFGKNHRLKTLGHDPLLGWIFGTLNILTDTITLNDFSSYSVDMKTGLYIKEPISTIKVFKNGFESINEDYLRLVAAFISQSLHLYSDKYTKMGLPIPLISTISENLDFEYLKKWSGNLCKEQYDYLCMQRDIKIVGTQAIFSILINTLISFIHKLYYDEKVDRNMELYEVKTRKILLYSNVISSSSNLIYTCVKSHFTGGIAIKDFDLGGFLVTLFTSNTNFIENIKKEFVEREMNKYYDDKISELDRNINILLEELKLKEE